MESIKKELLARELTCLVVWENGRFESQKRGVAPLLELLAKEGCCRGGSAADKVVGRATAFLYRLLEISRLHAGVISRGALEVLQESNIQVTYDALVPGIRNRTNTGPCPMEAATAHCHTPEDALAAIRATLDKLSKT